MVVDFWVWTFCSGRESDTGGTDGEILEWCFARGISAYFYPEENMEWICLKFGWRQSGPFPRSRKKRGRAPKIAKILWSPLTQFSRRQIKEK
jgi:hypothetical protein